MQPQYAFKHAEFPSNPRDLSHLSKSDNSLRKLRQRLPCSAAQGRGDSLYYRNPRAQGSAPDAGQRMAFAMIHPTFAAALMRLSIGFQYWL